MALAVVGCGPKAQLRDDPFVPGGAKPSRPWPFSRAESAPSRNADRADRDRARDVSTSPVTDPFSGISAGNASLRTSKGGAADLNDDYEPRPRQAREDPPLAAAEPLREDTAPRRGAEADSLAKGSGAAEQPNRFAAKSDPPANEPKEETEAEKYAAVRRRLEKAGASNFLSETDPATGKHFFRCEIPNPNDPELSRVFENNVPADDDLQAMLAVTAAVEEFLANPPKP